MHSDSEMVKLRDVVETLIYMTDEDSDGVEEVMQLPTIEIVTCGECKYRILDDDFQSGHFCLKRRSNGGLYCEDEDFCSYGERRNDD
jgi:hypothetical protein